MEHVKMSLKTAKTWSVRLITVLLFFISFYISHVFLQSYAGTSKARTPSRMACSTWTNSSKKWEALGFNVTRRAQLFLRLGDFLWKDSSSSSLPLPYGVKGSEFYLLKVLAIVANYGMPDSVESLPCRTCVVIGNGFGIKNSSLGATINKYDVVIRLNNAPVRGYERDVGSKTTMRFFYPESASDNPDFHNEPNTMMVLVPFKQQDLRWIKEILYDEKRMRRGFWKPPPQFWLGKASQIRILDPFFMQQTASRLLNLPMTSINQNPSHPTTGILAIYVAMNFCDVVHVAGFGYPENRDQRQPIHYYGGDTMRSMTASHHDLRRESEALRRLEHTGAILFLTRPS
ncbi:hypothetical protein COCON_G00073790 [Conger conger]|uniref:CMP-N-acetylneuraminate-beta-galactosamide-alpha-2,3-sialyltransferase 4 n=1 Tax=Conger conger TaxID=82655 RepID=A0A9Q1DN57_CONCO|nr:hypothetical protein COCON_G00073790 [Conger conger]